MSGNGQKMLQTVFSRDHVIINLLYVVIDAMNKLLSHSYVAIDLMDELLGRAYIVFDAFDQYLCRLNVAIHILDDAVHMVCNHQVFSNRHQALLPCKRVQPRKRILDVRPSKKPLQKHFYTMISQVTSQQGD